VITSAISSSSPSLCSDQIKPLADLIPENRCVRRDCKITEQLDYYSAIALLGFSLIIAIVRALSLTTEAARVTVAAPIIGFTASHITALMSFIDDYCKQPKPFCFPCLPLYVSGKELLHMRGSAYDQHTPGRSSLTVVLSLPLPKRHDRPLWENVLFNICFVYVFKWMARIEYIDI
jgi:hypothetical protein